MTSTLHILLRYFILTSTHKTRNISYHCLCNFQLRLFDSIFVQSDWGFRRVYFHVLFVFIVRLCPLSSLGSILPFSCVSLSLFVQETIVSATPAPGTWQHLGAATPVHHTCHLPAATIHTNRSFVCVKDFCT